MSLIAKSVAHADQFGSKIGEGGLTEIFADVYSGVLLKLDDLLPQTCGKNQRGYGVGSLILLLALRLLPLT